MSTRTRKGPPGVCAVCGTHCDQLTLEHIPPRSAYNNTRLDTYEFEDIIKQAQVNPMGSLHDLRRAGVEQGGMKRHATCGRCNNLVSGQWYAPAYADWVRQLMRFNIGAPVRYLSLPFRLRPLNILKQIAYMFLAINPHMPGDREELKPFVLGQHRQVVPSRFRFYAGLYMGRRAKHMGGTARANVFVANSVEWLSEIAMRPLALLMTVEGKRQEHLMDITDWTYCFRYDEVWEGCLKLPNVAEIQHIPADYRSDEEVRAAVRENLAREAEDKARKARAARHGR